MDIIRFLNNEDVDTTVLHAVPLQERAVALKTLYDRDLLHNLPDNDFETVLGIIGEAVRGDYYNTQIDIAAWRAFHKWIFGESTVLPELTASMRKFIVGFHCTTEHDLCKYYRARVNAAATIQHAIDTGGSTPSSQDEWFALILNDQHGVIMYGGND